MFVKLETYLQYAIRALRNGIGFAKEQTVEEKDFGKNTKLHQPITKECMRSKTESVGFVKKEQEVEAKKKILLPLITIIKRAR